MREAGKNQELQDASEYVAKQRRADQPAATKASTRSVPAVSAERSAVQQDKEHGYQEDAKRRETNVRPQR